MAHTHMHTSTHNDTWSKSSVIITVMVVGKELLCDCGEQMIHTGIPTIIRCLPVSLSLAIMLLVLPTIPSRNLPIILHAITYYSCYIL